MPWPADHQAVLRHFPWPLDRPSSFMKFTHDPPLFPPSRTATALSFDGHVGVHRICPMSLPEQLPLVANPKICTARTKANAQVQTKKKWESIWRIEQLGGSLSLTLTLATWYSSTRAHRQRSHQGQGVHHDPSTSETASSHPWWSIPVWNPYQETKHLQRSEKAFNSIKCYAVDEFHRANRTCSRRNSPDERSRSHAMFRPTCLRPSTPGSARKILNSMTLWIASVIDSGCRSPSGFGIAAWRPCPSKSPGDQRLQHVSAKQANRHRDVRLPDLAAGTGQKLVDRPGVGYKMHGGFREENGNLTTKTKKRKKKQKTHTQKTFPAQSQDEPYISSKNCVFCFLFFGFWDCTFSSESGKCLYGQKSLGVHSCKNRTPQKPGHSQLSFQQIKCLHDKNWLQVICQERHNKGLLPLRSRCQILIKGRYLE